MKLYKLLFVFLLPGSGLLAQNRYDVVITEIMADPSPSVGLPSHEWLELKNCSAAPINLQNWRVGDSGGQSGPFPNYILQPDSFVIVCTGSALTAMTVFGATISVTGFPSLDNDGELLFLRAANGSIIHATEYTSGWYRNEVKKEGGWTLEMIDPLNPCTGMANWSASTHTAGGTPGRKNSIDAPNNDTGVPQLMRAYTTDSSTILLVYDEPVDSLSGATLAHYTTDAWLNLSAAVTLPPLFNRVQLRTASPLTAGTVYTITALLVTDCKGHPIGSLNKARVGLPADAGAGEWIINEILFNPRSNAFDFVEFYNNSDKIFDAAKLYIANRNSAGVTSSVRPLSPAPFYIFPGDHIAATEDADNLALQYPVKQADRVLTLASLPSFPDEEGTVVTLNFQGEVVDEVKYRDDWHFKLINDPEGISLERIDPAGPSQDATNWHSAAFTAGYATPGYRNSQYKRTESISGRMEVNPKIFSPDNDGRDDIATLQYEVTEPGYAANVTVYDAAGRPVRHLIRNAVLGLSGYWNWDGLDDKGQKLPLGIYVLFTELFNLQGKKEKFKNTVVLARWLR